ncbi:MAG: hypothetical protein KH111_19870 [Bacteroidales bacterium]|nr:hypothetical protein [Bacteroidales bacterium]
MLVILFSFSRWVKEEFSDISKWDDKCFQTFIRENAAIFRVFASKYVHDSDVIDDILRDSRYESGNLYFFLTFCCKSVDGLSYLNFSQIKYTVLSLSLGLKKTRGEGLIMIASGMRWSMSVFC